VPTSASPHAVTAYGNYGTVTTPGIPMCRGNPNNSLSMPGGTASQTFTVPSGVSTLTTAKIQIDPAPEVTAHFKIFVNGSLKTTTTAKAAGDTHFDFGPVAVSAGQVVTFSVTFTASAGKIITVYSVGHPGGTFKASNSCPDGAPNITTTATGLRAVISGWS